MVALKSSTVPHLHHYWVQHLLVMSTWEMVRFSWLCSLSNSGRHQRMLWDWVTLTSFWEFLFALAFSSQLKLSALPWLTRQHSWNQLGFRSTGWVCLSQAAMAWKNRIVILKTSTIRKIPKLISIVPNLEMHILKKIQILDSCQCRKKNQQN